MASETHCPICNAPLPEPGARCRRCLLGLGLLNGESESLGPGFLDDLPVPEDTALIAGKYRIVTQIGRGAMGVVYRAIQEPLDRVVAVKMLTGGTFAGEELRQRFLVEAKAAADLKHPNIVAIHDWGADQGQPFLAMEWVDGGNLSALVRERPLTPRQAAQLLERVAQAVHHAHGRGIVHRDLKPSNILVDSDGQPKVADFGLAKRLGDGSDLTLTGQVLGTPGYLSPEQASPRFGPVGARSDVYALGAILYHLLTGRPPFQSGELAETLRQVLEHVPVSPRSINPAVPRELAVVALKCLEKEPDRRYASASDLAEDLDRWLTGRPIRARPAGILLRASSWVRRRPAAAGALGLAVVAGVLGLSLWIETGRREKESARVVEATRQSRNTRQLLSIMDAETRGDPRRHISVLTRIVRENKSSPVSGATSAGRIACQRLMSLLSARSYLLPAREPISHPLEDTGIALGRGGTLLVAATMERFVFFWDLAQAKVCREPVPVKSTVRSLRLSPDDSKLLVCLADDPPFLVAVQGGDTRGIPLEEGPGPALFGVFDPGGQRLATVHPGGGCAVWDVAEARLLASAPSQDTDIVDLAFLPGGGEVVSVSSKGECRRWDPTTGVETMPAVDLGGRPTSAQLDPDGRRLAIANGSKVQVLSLGLPHGAQPQMVVLTQPAPVHQIVWSPDARHLVIVNHGSGERTYESTYVWDAVAGVQISGPMRHGDMIESVAFSPTGLLLATGSNDQTVRVWAVDSGEPLTQPVWSWSNVNLVAFTDRGDQLVTVTGDGAVLWELSVGGPQPVSWPMDGMPTVAGFDQDGGRILVGTSRGQVLVLNAVTGVPMAPSLPHPAAIRYARWLGGEGALVTIADDRWIRLWNPREGRVVDQRDMDLASLACLDASRGQKVIAAAGREGWVRTWEVSDRIRPLAAVRSEKLVSSIRVSPDGGTFALVTVDGAIALWDSATGKPLGRRDVEVPAVAMQNGSSALKDFMALARGANKDQLLAQEFDLPSSVTSSVARRSGTNRRWDLAEFLSPVTNRTDPRLVGRSNPPSAWDGVVEELFRPTTGAYTLDCRFSPDSRLLAAGGAMGGAMVWGVDGGTDHARPRRTFHQGPPVWAVSFSPESRRVALGDALGVVRIWDIDSGEPITDPMEHGDGILRVEFSPEGNRIATMTLHHALRLWDAETGLPLSDPRPLPSHVTGLEFSPDGQRLLLPGRDGYLRMVDAWAPTVEVPGWFPRAADVLSGIDTQSAVEQGLSPTDLYRVAVQRQRGASTNSLEAWGKWLFSGGPVRPVSAQAMQSRRDLASVLSAQGNLASLRRASFLDPTHAASLARLARAYAHESGKADEGSVRARARACLRVARLIDPNQAEVLEAGREIEDQEAGDGNGDPNPGPKPEPDRPQGAITR